MNVIRLRALLLVTAGLSVGFPGPQAARADELYDYGEYLASECTTCHQLSGKSDGIPSITGWPVDHFVSVLKSYRDGARENKAMRSVAGRLSDEEITALAVYFNRQQN